MIDHRNVPITIALLVCGTLLAIVSMNLIEEAYEAGMPERRMKYCIDTGHSYVYDTITRGVSCK